MNKTEFIDRIRHPEKINEDSFADLESIIAAHPYFYAARLLITKGCSQLRDRRTKQQITSTALYATNRVLFKKYLSGVLRLSTPPQKTTATFFEARTPIINDPVADLTPELSSGGIDILLEELNRDMQDLKSSRLKFADLMQKIDEEEAISAAVKRVSKHTTKSIKNSEISTEKKKNLGNPE